MADEENYIVDGGVVWHFINNDLTRNEDDFKNFNQVVNQVKNSLYIFPDAAMNNFSMVGAWSEKDSQGRPIVPVYVSATKGAGPYKGGTTNLVYDGNNNLTNTVSLGGNPADGTHIDLYFDDIARIRTHGKEDGTGSLDPYSSYEIPLRTFWNERYDLAFGGVPGLYAAYGSNQDTGSIAGENSLIEKLQRIWNSPPYTVLRNDSEFNSSDLAYNHPNTSPPGLDDALARGVRAVDDFKLFLRHAPIFFKFIDPLVLNLSANSAPNTTTLFEGTQFDLQNNGFKQLTAWIGADSGILVYDPTDDPVTNGSQLFSTAWSLSGGGYAVDGFSALADLDSNTDDVIDSDDDAWADLRVWIDSNINGVTDNGELVTLGDIDIESINLTTTNTNTTDENGNYIGKTATYSLAGGGTRQIADVSFYTEANFTTPANVVEVSPEVAALPDIHGSGIVTSLQQAMELDGSGDLQDLIEDFIAANDDTTRDSLVDDIIYLWTGIDDVSPSSRGAYFDAQKLEALEHFSGVTYIDPFNSTTNPAQQAAAYLAEAYSKLHDEVLSRLQSQTNLASLFGDITQAIDLERLTTYLDFSVVEADILSELEANRSEGLTRLAALNRTLHALDMDVDQGFATFRSDLIAQGDDVAATFLFGESIVKGGVGADVITAWKGDQTLIATQGGRDTLIGGDANNIVIRGAGLLIGGTGDNQVFWGYSNQLPEWGGDPDMPADTFIAGQGTQTFHESGTGHALMYYGAGSGDLTILNYKEVGHGNRLILDLAINRDDVEVESSGDGFEIADGVVGDIIRVLNRHVDTLEFADGTTIDLWKSGGIQQATSNSTLSGTSLNDIYSYDPGTGTVTLNDTGGVNEIWLGGTLTAANISLSTSGNDLLISDGVGGDLIKDKNFGVQTIRFSDGSTLDLHTAGNTYTLTGSTTSTGTGGNDLYSFAASLGTATISDPGGLNTIKLGAGISAAGLGFTGSGTDLLITDGIGGDKIIIQGQLGDRAVINTIKFNDNSTLDLTAGLALSQAASTSIFNGTGGNDTLTANAGTLTINGNGGNDIFIVGAGSQTINAGAGDDIFSYHSGDGLLTVSDTGGANTVKLGPSITTGSISLVASGHDLLITDGVGGDTITLKNQLDTDVVFDSLVFNSGTTWSLQGIALTANTSSLYGTPGDNTLTAAIGGTETLYGNGGNDTFVGATGTEIFRGDGYGGSNTFITGTGPTTAYGGSGEDVYSYGSGDGQLTVIEEGGQNTIALGSGLSSVTLTASGHDLLLTDGVGGDIITLKNQLTSVEGVQMLTFYAGGSLALNGVALTANAASLYGTAGGDTLTATSGTQTLTGNGGNDIYILAGGSHMASGGTGNDTYSYHSGDGLVTIIDHGGTDTLKLGSGISTGDVILTPNGHDLLITDSVGGDTITLKDHLSAQTGLSQLAFNGGTTWALQGMNLTANAAILYGTVGADTLNGTSGTQTLVGNGGADSYVAGSGLTSMVGTAGNETFTGHATGTTRMIGNGGSDHFVGAGGIDTMTGSTGNDTFNAGIGTETMTGGGGNDIFIAGGGTASATGSSGDDLYSFASGGGALIVSDAGGTDTLKLGTGLNAGSVTLSESTNGADLYITDGVGGDSITIKNAVASASSADRVEKLIYGDGSTLLLTGGLALYARTGSSTLFGIAGANNTLIAVAGGATETLKGFGGNDTYSYSSGNGIVVVDEGSNGGTDTLKLGSGQTAANVTLSMGNAADLLVTNSTGGDLLTIKNQSAGLGQSALEFMIYGDGTTVSLVSALKIYASSGTATVTGTSSGGDTLIGSTGTQTLNGNGGNGDTFIGGTGTQTLNGSGGANQVFIAGTGAQTALGNSSTDVYSYVNGNGVFTISDTGGTDTLKLGGTLTLASLTFTENSSGTDLIITDGVGGDTITLKNHISQSGNRIEKLIDSTSATLDLTSGLTLMATTGSTTLNALSGNDILIAVSGANTETLKGGDGNDIYSYHSGDGKVLVSDSNGTDTLKLGSGLTTANIVFAESANGADLIITDGVAGDTITLKGSINTAANKIETIIYGDGTTASLSGIILYATPGNTLLDGTAGNDILVGTAGNQTLRGMGGNDTFNGGTGTQTLTGNTGNDVFFAGVGVTSATGSSGNDVYHYVSNDGAFIISDSGGTDTLVLDDLSSGNITISESSNAVDMLITDGISGDTITLKNCVSTSGNRLETLVFSNGTSISLTTNLVLTAQAGSSTLFGFSGTNNTLIATAGGSTETLKAFGGNDTYSYDSGCGIVLIDEGGNGGTETLKLGSGLTAANVTLWESNGFDLIITDNVGGDTLTLKNEYPSGSSTIETLIYGDGSTFNLGSGGAIIYAVSGTSSLNGTSGSDTMIASSGTQKLAGGGGNDTFFGGTGTQTLTGNTGNDVFYSGSGTISAVGSSGNDIYSYAAGSGGFVVSDSAGTDTIKLASGINPYNAFFTDSTNAVDLIITDGTSGDEITVKSFGSSVVEKLIFNDGTTVDLTTVKAASSSATTLNGTASSDILVPSTSNLTIAGAGGNDLYNFGVGMGADKINNGVSTTNNAAGTLLFGHSIGKDELWFDRVDNSGTISGSGDNLRIIIMGTTSKMTINGWYIGGSSTYKQLSLFQLSDDGLKLDSQLSNLVSAMATFETSYAAGHGGTPFDPTAVSSITDTTVLSTVNSAWY